MINNLFIFLVVLLILYALVVDVRKMVNKKTKKSETVTLLVIHGITITLAACLFTGIHVHMPTRFFIDQIAVPLSEWLKEQT